MDKELTETQFNFLKALCEKEKYIMIVPAMQEDDAPEYKEKYETAMKDIRELSEMGFIENITDKFAEMLEQVQAEGARGFEAYVVSESTVRMFTPGAAIQ